MLYSFMDGSTSTTSESSEFYQLNQMLNHDIRITQSSGYRLLQNAYRLLKTELSVQVTVLYHVLRLKLRKNKFSVFLLQNNGYQYIYLQFYRIF